MQLWWASDLLHPCWTLCRCGAVFVTQPLDLIKNRMQLSGKCVWHFLMPCTLSLTFWHIVLKGMHDIWQYQSILLKMKLLRFFPVETVETSYTWSLRLSIQIVCIKRSVLEDANTWTFGFCVHWCLQWPSCFSDRSHPAQFFNIWLVRLVAMYLLCRMGATVFVQPLDLVKNRMQLSGETVEAGSCFIFEHR